MFAKANETFLGVAYGRFNKQEMDLFLRLSQNLKFKNFAFFNC